MRQQWEGGRKEPTQHTHRTRTRDRHGKEGRKGWMEIQLARQRDKRHGKEERKGWIERNLAGGKDKRHKKELRERDN